MAESIHDWAVKLGMIKDEASFSAAEKLMDDFTNATIRNNERVKRSNEERVAAEKQARLMAEGEKIRQANLSPMEAANENAVRQMERLDELMLSNALSTQLWEKELEKVYATFLQLESMDDIRIAQAGAGIQSVGMEAEVARTQELADLKTAILNRAAEQQRIDQMRLTQEYATTIQLRKEQEQSYEADMAAMRAFYRQQEIDGAKASKIAQMAADEAYDKETRRLLEQKRKYEAAREYGFNSQMRQDRARAAAEAIRLAGAEEQQARAAAIASREQAELNALLRQYGNHADIVQGDINRLNAALASQAITAEQHGVAVAEATRRMNSMRGGAGNMGYAIGELARGAEDFITVMSITGFKAESVGMAMRGAGNNISQAANLLYGPLTGAAIGVAAILGGQLVSSLMRSKEEFKDNSLAIRQLTDDFTVHNQEVERFLKIQKGRDEAASGSFGIVELEKKLTSFREELPTLNNELDKTEKKFKAWQTAVFVNIRPEVSTYKDLQKSLEVIRGLTDENGNRMFHGVADGFQKEFTRIQSQLQEGLEDKSLSLAAVFKRYADDLHVLENSVNRLSVIQTPEGPIGNQADFPEIDTIREMLKDEKNMNKFTGDRLDMLEAIKKANGDVLDIEKQIADLEALRSEKFKAFRAEMTNEYETKIALASATSQAEKDEINHQTEIVELRKKYKDLGWAGLAIAKEELALKEKLRDAEREAEAIKARNEEREKLDTLYETMKLKSEELLMISKLTEEEKKSYEFAKRRAEILSTGAASPGELEAIFQNEMMAKRNDLEAEWKKTAPSYQTAGSNLTQTTASMNSEILRAMGQTKDKDMLSELKAIKEALINPRGGVKLVEVN